MAALPDKEYFNKHRCAGGKSTSVVRLLTITKLSESRGINHRLLDLLISTNTTVSDENSLPTSRAMLS